MIFSTLLFLLFDFNNVSFLSKSSDNSNNSTLLLTLIPPIFRKVSLSKKSKCRHFIYLLSWLIALV